MCVCVMTRCINIYHIKPNEGADGDLKAHNMKDGIMSLWF